MWSRISGRRCGFDIASVPKGKPPFLALVHRSPVTFDVYQLAHDRAVALFGKSAREWVWVEIFGVGASEIPRLIEPTQSEFLSVFTSAHLVDARQCFGVRQREGSRVEYEI